MSGTDGRRERKVKVRLSVLNDINDDDAVFGTHRDVDGPGCVTLDGVTGDGGHPGVRHPHRGQGEVGHVQEAVPGDEVIPPPAVRVLGQEPEG